MQVVDSLKSHDSTTNSQYVTLLDFIHELSKDDKETIARDFTYLDLDVDALRVKKELLNDDTYVLRVRTTNVANDYIEKRNVLALRRLITQYT